MDVFICVHLYNLQFYLYIFLYMYVCLILSIGLYPPSVCLSFLSFQNALARAVTRTPRHHPITPVLKSLHWLKLRERIHFKVLSLTYNSLQSSQPTFLRELFTIQPTRSTRSSSCHHPFSTPGHFS